MTGDSYTGKKYSSVAGLIECDCTAHYIGSYGCGEDDDDDKDVFDQSISMELVKCVPDTVWHHEGDTSRIGRVMAPMVSFVSPEAERGSSVVIGLLNRTERQMTDKGVLIHDSSADLDTGQSLTIDNLYEKYHKDFAIWVGKDRQEVSAELNLTMAELSSFRLWQKVRFAGRLWLVKKLTIDFAPGRMSVRGDFISL